MKRVYLGNAPFIEQMHQSIRKKLSLGEVLKKQGRRVAMPLREYAAQYRDRDRAMA